MKQGGEMTHSSASNSALVDAESKPIMDAKDTNRVADNSHCIKVCNKLLRVEVSAVAAYDMVVVRFSDEPQVDEVRSIRQEHSRSAEELRQNVISMGGTPCAESGALGIFVTAVQLVSNLCGDNAAVDSLINGEEYGQNEYHKALADDDVMPDCKTLIHNRFLPRVNQHIRKLNALKVTF